MTMWVRAIAIGAVAGLMWSATVHAENDDADDAAFDCSRVGTLKDDATREEMRDPKLHFRSTKLYFTQELFEKSARSAELATTLDPTQSRYFLRLAMAYAELGCYEAAGEAFRAAEAIVADDEKQMKDDGPDIENNRTFFHNARFNAANELFNEGKHAEALAEYQNAISIDPASVLAWRNIGVVKSSMDDLGSKREGLEAFQKALELEPDNVKTQDSYRILLATVAVNSYNEALIAATGAEEAGSAEAVTEMGKSLDMLNKAMQTGAEGEELMELNQHGAMINQAIGQFAATDEAKNAAYREAVEYHRAAAVLRRKEGSSINDDPEYLKSLLGCFSLLEQSDSLFVYGAKLIDVDPKAAEGYQYKAHALREGGDNKSALTFLLMNKSLTEGKSLTESADLNGHIAQLISVYKPSDDIVKASIMNLENPDEIRFSNEGSDVIEVWIWWTKGKAETYYNGSSAGTIEFKAMSEADAEADADAEAVTAE